MPSILLLMPEKYDFRLHLPLKRIMVGPVFAMGYRHNALPVMS